MNKTDAQFKLELLMAALRRAQDLFDQGELYAWQARWSVRTAMKLARELEGILEAGSQ